MRLKKKQRKSLMKRKAQANSITEEASARAEREASQISREVVASARQGNQKEILIAKRKSLDSTLSMQSLNNYQIQDSKEERAC